MLWKKKPHGAYELFSGGVKVGWINTAMLLPDGDRIYVWSADCGEGKEGWNFSLVNAKADTEDACNGQPPWLDN